MSGIIFALILTYVAILAGWFGHILGYTSASNKLRSELREAWAERDKHILLRKLRVPYGEEDKA